MSDNHPEIPTPAQELAAEQADHEAIRHDLQDLFRGAVRAVLELVLEEEVQRIIGAGRYSRAKSRVDSRNGSYLRDLITSLGTIEVRMPRTRNSGAPTHVLGAYERRVDEVDDAIVASYVNGVSTRNMSQVTEALLGSKVGRSTVSRVTSRLEEAVEELKKTRIERPIPYLYLDATFLDVRWAGSVENISALVAYGVNDTGHRVLLGVTMGPQESEASWSELLQQLCDRGLHGVRLVITDEHQGLKNAARKYLPEAKRQRCVVHLLRNVGGKLPKRHRQRVLREASAIFRAEGLKAARAKLEQFRGRWGKLVPEAVECLVAGFEDSCQFYGFPKGHWTRIRTTNGLERLHGEIKRRTRAVGAFPDRASALRLITAVALRTTNAWADRRYLDMGLLT